MTLTPKVVRLAERLKKQAENCSTRQVMRVNPADLLALATAVLGRKQETERTTDR